jgi:hypothetical protein
MVVGTASTMIAACDMQRGATDAAARAAADSAEQVMYHASTIITMNGLRRGSITADTVKTYDALTRFGFRRMEVQFTTSLGRPLALLTAPGGEYSLARSSVHTTGPVTIVSDTSGRRMTGTAVRFDAATNQLTSDSAFSATAGSRKLSGVGFTADPGLFTVKCLSRCTGSLR